MTPVESSFHADHNGEIPAQHISKMCQFWHVNVIMLQTSSELLHDVIRIISMHLSAGTTSEAQFIDDRLNSLLPFCMCHPRGQTKGCGEVEVLPDRQCTHHDIILRAVMERKKRHILQRPPVINYTLLLGAMHYYTGWSAHGEVLHMSV